MQNLKPGALLQGGKYQIVKPLGQGGFGITYLAEQVALSRKVAIKEFFFKDFCERDESTCLVTLGTQSNRTLVDRFLKKFIKEARTISQFDHPNIIRIIDIFDENGTAYYVMDYVEGSSLAEVVKKRGPLPEKEALGYINEVGEALVYVHQHHVNHLDIKPDNIMLKASDGKIVLIDFGVSKQYDADTAQGTTTTPVGISHGYSPSEQYRQNGVQSFSPQSDVYALAATLYKLLTGVTPPDAIAVKEEGLPLAPLLERQVSPTTINAILDAMKSQRERTQSVELFLQALAVGGDAVAGKALQSEKTIVRTYTAGDDKAEATIVNVDQTTDEPQPAGPTNSSWKAGLLSMTAFLLLLVAGLIATNRGCSSRQTYVDSTFFVADSLVADTAVARDSVLTFDVNGVSFNMILVDNGTFEMCQGTKSSHQVTLTRDYYIGENLVTQGLWKAVMGSRRLYNGDGSNCPVHAVSWNQCQNFIKALNKLTGLTFRLPTEAEWEYAARGGKKSRGYKYSGSDNLADVAYQLNFKHTTNADGSVSTRDLWQPVAIKQPNELGIYDMTGTVFQWCQDRYAAFDGTPQTDPTGPEKGDLMVQRGGCWSYWDGANVCEISFRQKDSADYGFGGTGFRLALSAD